MLTQFLLMVKWTFHEPLPYQNCSPKYGIRCFCQPFEWYSLSTVLYNIFYFHKASFACWWSCSPNSYWASTGLVRGSIVSKYEAPIIEYRVLASPWILIPLKLYYTTFTILTRLAMPVSGCVNQSPFKGRLAFSRAPSS